LELSHVETSGQFWQRVSGGLQRAKSRKPGSSRLAITSQQVEDRFAGDGSYAHRTGARRAESQGPSVGRDCSGSADRFAAITEIV